MASKPETDSRNPRRYFFVFPHHCNDLMGYPPLNGNGHPSQSETNKIINRDIADAERISAIDRLRKFRAA